MTTQRLFARFYYAAPNFVDGTTEFHRLCCAYVPSSTEILEIGAGPGNPTSAFLAGMGKVTGVDVSNEVLSNPFLAEAKVYDGYQLPFENHAFKFCASDYVLEHVTNPSEHFREIARVLRPGGVYCFRTPNLWHYVTIASRLLPYLFHKRLANRLRGMDQGARDPYPTVYKSNTRNRISALAKAAGLETQVLRTIEKEPSYGKSSAILFFPMMLYERLVNSSKLLAGFRVNILGVLRKPVDSAPTQSNSLGVNK